MDPFERFDRNIKAEDREEIPRGCGGEIARLRGQIDERVGLVEIPIGLLAEIGLREAESNVICDKVSARETVEFDRNPHVSRPHERSRQPRGELEDL